MQLALIISSIIGGGAVTLLSLQRGLAVYTVLLPFLSLRGVSLGQLGTASGTLTLVIIGSMGIRFLVQRAFIRFSVIAPWLAGFALVSILGLRQEGTSVLFGLMPLYYLAFHILLASSITTERTARRLVAAVAFATATLSLLALSAYTVGWPAWGTGMPIGRLEGPADNPNAFANMLVLGIPLVLAQVLITRKRFHKFLWFGGFFISMSSLVLTSSRSAYLAMLAAAAILFLGFNRRARRVFVVGICFILLLVLAGTVMEFWGHLSVARAGSVLNDQGRLHQVYVAAQVVRDHPLFGVGPGRFEQSIRESDPKALPYAHSNLVLAAVEGGITGCLLLMVVFYKSVLLPLKAARRSNGTRRVVLTALSASIGGYFVHGLFHVNYRWAFLWFVITIAVTMAQESKSQIRSQVG